MRKPLIWSILAVAVVAVLSIGLFVGGSSESSSDQTQTPAPGVVFSTFEGKQVTLHDFRGQPVVLNFFASWCPACIAEMPDFEAVHSGLGDRDVKIIGVAQSEVPPLGSAEGALALRESTGITYDIFQDPTGALYSAFQGFTMPTTLFFDEAGNQE